MALKPAGITPVLLAALLLASVGPRPASAWVGAAPQAEIVTAPEPISPANGATISGFGPSLQWSLPPGSTQYQLQVVPINNDGPGVNLIIGSAGDRFAIPAPPSWYGLLPDMTYTWRLRASDAQTGLSENASGWGPWSTDRTFRTPAVSSDGISLSSPRAGAVVDSTSPTLVWSSADSNLYYYEVQVSRDPGFGPNAFLYWELRHGGVTSPANSYTIPNAYPLEANATYYWRVRPRVQGDGRAVAWSNAGTFSTRASSPSSDLLRVTSPADESTVTSATVEVRGQTRPGAFVTVNEYLASVDASGTFQVTVTLQPGPNELEIIASDPQGNSARTTVTVTYATP